MGCNESKFGNCNSSFIQFYNFSNNFSADLNFIILAALSICTLGSVAYLRFESFERCFYTHFFEKNSIFFDVDF